MGKSKRLQSPPHRKNSGSQSIQSKSVQRRRSLLTLVSSDEITEGTLQVWRSLPTKIRQDPSLEPFQRENERVHGTTPIDSDANDDLDDATDGGEVKDNLIQIHVTNEDGIDNHLEDISTIRKGSSLTNMTTATNNSSTPSLKHSTNPWHDHSKLIFLLLTWFCSMVFMTTESEKKIHHKLLSIDDFDTKYYLLPTFYYKEQISIALEGPFLDTANETGNQITVSLKTDTSDHEFVGNEWLLPIPDHHKLDYTPITLKRRIFSVDRSIYERQKNLKVSLRKNTQDGLTVKLFYDPTPVNIHVGAVCALNVLLMFYILIIYDIVHRTFAAIMSSIVAIGLLAAQNDRPLMSEIVEWMNCETLLLLFSMMILVAILTETGIFNYIAVYAFQVTNGHIWPLIFSLCLITAVVSAFLHNVTTILLMTPITIKLCECLGLNPVPILMAVILNGNIGAAATPLGHVPNLLITGDPIFAKHGITFFTYTIHMIGGVVLAFVQTCAYFRWEFHDIHKLRMKEPKEVTDLRHEITVWERTAASLSTYRRDSHVVRETLMKKVGILQTKLKRQESVKAVSSETYKATLEELKKTYPIKNPKLLMKSGFALTFIISMFFLQSIPQLENLSVGWCALIGVMLLLIIAEKDDMDALMHRIEWTTLLFFAAMFVTLECLERLCLIQWFSEQTINLISTFEDENYQLALAIVIVLWLSGLLSSLVDSIPVTAMMIKIVISIAENDNIKIPIQPLVWAVAFGPCFGGNGTLYGASANILCAGIAEQHGYKMSFSKYFRKCFPIMIASLITTTGYLFIAHVVFHWHSA